LDFLSEAKGRVSAYDGSTDKGRAIPELADRRNPGRQMYSPEGKMKFSKEIRRAYNSWNSRIRDITRYPGQSRNCATFLDVLTRSLVPLGSALNLVLVIFTLAMAPHLCGQAVESAQIAGVVKEIGRASCRERV